MLGATAFPCHCPALHALGNNRPKLDWVDWDALRMREELEGRKFSVFHYSNMAGVGMQMAMDSCCGKLRAKSMR